MTCQRSAPSTNDRTDTMPNVLPIQLTHLRTHHSITQASQRRLGPKATPLPCPCPVIAWLLASPLHPLSAHTVAYGDLASLIWAFGVERQIRRVWPHYRQQETRKKMTRKVGYSSGHSLDGAGMCQHGSTGTISAQLALLRIPYCHYCH